jgi:hypothetical protein
MKESNEKALAILGQQYNSTINLTENWEFFRGLAEYVKTVESLYPTKRLVEALEMQREIGRKVYEQFNTQAFRELTWSAARMTEIAQKVAIQYAPIMKQVQEMQKRLNEVYSSDRLQDINNNLLTVAKKLQESGLADAIKKFENTRLKVPNIPNNYIFSQAYEKLPEEKEKLQRVEQIEPWGAWQQLPFAKRMVYEPQEVIEEVKVKAETDPQQKWVLMGLLGVNVEMEAIRTGKTSDKDVVFFKIKDYKGYLQRFHNYISAELLKTSDANDKLDFDPVKSILQFAGKVITISKRAQSDAHDLLRTVFKDRNKEWNTDEVLDDWRFDVDNKTPKNKVYQAGKAVNRIVAQKTQIEDFLIVNSGSYNLRT